METNTTFHEMVWHAHKNGHIADGRWQATEVHPENLFVFTANAFFP